MQAKALEISGLGKHFGATEALRDIGFELAIGSSLALVGPDGAGKTTMIRLIAGLLAPTSGQVRVFGSAPRSREAKARMGYLSQRFSLYSDLSIDENIAFFAEIHGLAEYAKRRDRLLEMTRLMPFRDRTAGKLSGGMKQKLALACALVHQPDLLLLDEPTTGVDPISRREFWAILAELLAQGMSLIVATPYLDEAERCAEVGLLDAGSFLAFGSPDKLKSTMPFVVLELPCSETKRAAALLEGLPELAGVQTFGDHLALLAPDENAARRAVAARLGPAGFEVEGLRVSPPTLENVFMNVVGHRVDPQHRKENFES
ncbi:MAG: ABC transporter ATP-binding protein [Spirochaetales bacterium]|nr:MAG: ABC transporter ATP-binding protein [Spirochaetales bacterium]